MSVIAADEVVEIDVIAEIPATAPRRRFRPWWLVRRAFQLAASAIDWLFGIVSLVIGLSILAALPVAQLLSLGYFLESSARVARSGRLRDGIIGVRKASRIGRAVIGVWLACLPFWFTAAAARSADLIDPGGPTARAWRAGAIAVGVLTAMHLATACLRGARLRYFLWPFGQPFWLIRRVDEGGLYPEVRDTLWAFVVGLRLPYYFRLGLVGFLGTLAWLVPPAILIAAGGRLPAVGVIGTLLLAVVVPFVPFLQVRYAVEGKFSSFFSRRSVRDRFARAPWAFAFALLVLLLAAVPLYLLKIEFIPREAAWLPSLVFVAFLAPARLLVGWAYARSERRERPRHWLFRWLGRIAIVPAAAFYVIVVFLAQYTSWGGVAALYEQHAFLLPVPFVGM